MLHCFEDPEDLRQWNNRSNLEADDDIELQMSFVGFDELATLTAWTTAIVEKLTEATTLQIDVCALSELDYPMRPQWTSDAALGLFRAIGDLRKLQKLNLTTLGMVGNRIPLTCLTACMGSRSNNDSQLTYVQLGCPCLLVRTVDEWTDFANTLQSLSLLKSFSIAFKVETSFSEDAISLDPVVAVLANLQLIEKVHLQFREGTFLEGAALAQLCRSTSLQSLHLYSHPVTSSCLVSMWNAIRGIDSLSSLNFTLPENVSSVDRLVFIDMIHVTIARSRT